MAALTAMVRSMRWSKNLPLLLLLLGGLLAAGGDAPTAIVFTAFGVSLASSAFMTHLNIITDRELDRGSKPQLYAYLEVNPTLSVCVLTGELMLALFGIGWLASRGSFGVAFCLSCFLALTTLYSYNFLSPRPVETRWKTRWWGHLGAVVLGYLSLWCAGYLCTGPSDEGFFGYWVPLFTLASLSEYALFLSESAIDAPEEKQHRLQTLAALIGRPASSLVALVGAAGVAAVLGAEAWVNVDSLGHRALLPAVGWRLLVLLLLSLPWSPAVDRGLRAKLPDLTFHGSRLLTVVILGTAV